MTDRMWMADHILDVDYLTVDSFLLIVDNIPKMFTTNVKFCYFQYL